MKLLSILIAAVFLLLAGIPVMAEEEPSPSNSKESDTMTNAQKLLQEADSVFKSGKYVDSRDLYKNSLTEATELQDISMQVEALSQIARTYLTEDKKDTARIWLDKAGKLANESEPLGYSRYMGVEGRYLWRSDKKPEATELFKKQYEYCSSHKLYDRAIDAAHMVAITGTPEQQVEWGLKGIKEAEAGNIIRWLGPLWNNLGATYEEMGRYEKSLEAYLRAREYHYKTGTETNKMVADWAVGHAYINLKDYENGKKWLGPLIEWCKRLDNNEFLGLTYRELGAADYAEKKFADALAKYTQAEKLLKQSGMPEWDPDGYNKIVERIAELNKKDN